MDVKPYLEFLMVDVQFYINFGLFLLHPILIIRHVVFTFHQH